MKKITKLLPILLFIYLFYFGFSFKSKHFSLYINGISDVIERLF